MTFGSSVGGAAKREQSQKRNPLFSFIFCKRHKKSFSLSLFKKKKKNSRKASARASACVCAFACVIYLTRVRVFVFVWGGMEKKKSTRLFLVLSSC